MHMPSPRLARPHHLLVFGLLGLFACASVPIDERAPQDAFLAHLAALEGQAFEGRVVADEPPQENSPFGARPLVMHVRRVTSERVEVPFHVGEDRSRTWVLTPTENGLRLKHDHRKADGREDELTMYGGETDAPGSDRRQDFPVGAYSIDLFERLGYHASVTNVWTMEIEPGRFFAYELRRPGRLFRVEFDLTRAVEPPPAPWGHD